MIRWSIALPVLLLSTASIAQGTRAATPPPARPTQAAPPPSSEQAPPPPTAPPPAVDDESSTAAPPTEETAVEKPREVKLVRFGAGVSAGAAPSYYGAAWGFGAELGISLNFGQRFSLRLLANYTHTENGPYSTNVGLAVVEPTVWFGVFGVGAAVVFGAGDISRDGFGGAIGAFASPAKLRFGQGITHELSLDLGTILITSDPTGFSPFGRIGYNVYF